MPVSEKEFVFLETHSVYSLCEGTMTLRELINYASTHEFSYISLSDTNGFYGLIYYLKLSRQAGLRPLLSVRVKSNRFNGLLLARSVKGYEQISVFLSAVHQHKEAEPDALLSRACYKEIFVITAQREILACKLPHVYAEINLLTKNYGAVHRFARSNGVEPVLVYPVYFRHPRDYKLHRVLRAVYYKKKISALTRGEYQPSGACFCSAAAIRAKYAHFQRAIANTHYIAAKAFFNFSYGRPVFPSCGPGAYADLQKICYANISRRYDPAPAALYSRLQKELTVIRTKGFSDYFLVVHDIVSRFPITCGRGSAAASLVSYLLFITHVDPLEHNLFFERFLHEERQDPPDIDIDFPWDTRDKVLAYIFKKYGYAKTAMVANHITFSLRSSWREVARVYGLPENMIKAVNKKIISFYGCQENKIKKKRYAGKQDPSLAALTQQAQSLERAVRHLAVHCGGVIITPQPVDRYVPVQRSAKGVRIIQFEKEQAEAYGLVKMDILGNRSLAVVRDCLGALKANYNLNIDYACFDPRQDPRTIAMLARGDTIGVFYVESPAMRQLQQKTGRGDYYHLVIHSSIIRPAAHTYINEYVKRLHGKKFTCPLPELQNILEETYGIMCYQEDITRVAVAAAGFTLKQAQELRKTIGNSNKKKRIAFLKNMFFRKLAQRKVPQTVSAALWQMISSFAGYSFCKAHSASYALLSFKAAWLKAHYPAEFLAAVIKNGGGFYIAPAYIAEARRLGLQVIPPDINRSACHYYGCKDKIYTGLIQIKGLSRQAVMVCLQERRSRGWYTSLYDFLNRTHIPHRDTVLFVKSGCFDRLETLSRPGLLLLLHTFFQAEKQAAAGDDQRQQYEAAKQKAFSVQPYTGEQLFALEKEIFGFSLRCHPMVYYRPYLQKKQLIYAAELGDYCGQTVQIAGVLISAKTVMSKDHRLMQFVSFEDETAVCETVFFPAFYKKYYALLFSRQPCILTGTVREEFSALTLQVRKVTKIAAACGMKPVFSSLAS